MKYYITITEILKRKIEVEAESYAEAITKAKICIMTVNLYWMPVIW